MTSFHIALMLFAFLIVLAIGMNLLAAHQQSELHKLKDVGQR